MKRLSCLAIAAAALVVATIGTVHADQDRQCSCRANGTDYMLYSVVCIRIGSGSFMARCEMVLNNTAWKKLSDGCPLSQSPGRLLETAQLACDAQDAGCATPATLRP